MIKETEGLREAKNPGVRLRKLSQEDASLVKEWMSDGDAKKFLGYDWLSTEQMGEYIRDCSNEARLFMVEADGGLPVGVATLRDIDDVTKSASAEMLVARDFRDKGVSTRAGKELLRIAFGELGLKKVLAKIDVSNGPSLKSFSKQGYRKMREDDGVVTMEINVDDWKLARVNSR